MKDEEVGEDEAKDEANMVEARNTRGVVCGIQPDSRIKVAWNFFIILCCVFASFQIPLEVAFDEVDSYYLVMIGIQLIFLLDIFFTSRTSFYLETGDIVKNPKEIAKYYFLSFGFLLDLLASLPLQTFLPNLLGVNMKIMILLKLFRLNWTLSLSKQSETIKLALKIVNLFFYLILYIHFSACYLYSVVNVEKYWVPNQLRFRERGEDFYEADLQTKYVTILYSSILILLGNDTSPETNA